MRHNIKKNDTTISATPHKRQFDRLHASWSWSTYRSSNPNFSLYQSDYVNIIDAMHSPFTLSPVCLQSDQMIFMLCKNTRGFSTHIIFCMLQAFRSEEEHLPNKIYIFLWILRSHSNCYRFDIFVFFLSFQLSIVLCSKLWNCECSPD